MSNDGTVKLGVEFESDDVKKAFEDLKKEAKTTERALKEIDRALKLDPGNTETITEKQKLLSSAIKNSKDQISLLARELEKTGASDIVERDISAYQHLVNELSNTVSELREYENQLDSLNNQSEEARRVLQDSADSAKRLSSELQQAEQEADDFERQLENVSESAKSALSGFQQAENGADSLEEQLQDVSEAASRTEKGLDDVGDSANSAGGGFTVAKGAAATFAGNALTMVIDMALQAAEALWNLDEATEEYRESMGLLNTAFDVAGYTSETAQEAYRGFFEILGDTGKATEASQLLAQLATNEEDVAKWIEIAAGAYGTFGDSLPIEGLIEAANETAKTGEITGVLADALNWVGLSEEEVANQLSAISTETDRARYLMELLSTTYSEAADSFYKNNEAIMESRGAQAELDESLAVLGQSVADLKSQLAETFGPFLSELAIGVSLFIDTVAAGINALGDALDWLGDKVRSVIDWFQALFNSGSSSSANVSQGRIRTNASSRVGMRAFSNSPEGNSSSPEGNPLAGINTTATKDIEGAVSGMKRAVLTELSALMPSFVERVKFANQSMIPNSAQTISIQGDNQSAESWRGQGSGIVEHKVKIEIMPRELARFLHPYLSEEEKRVGVDLAT